MTPMQSLIACLSILLALHCPAVAAEGAPPGPRAVPLETSFDAGTLRQGEPIVHRFVIRNEGSDELRLVEVRAGCGCTSTHQDDRIPPGGTGTVQATVKTERMKGRIRKYVTVRTDDPRAESIRLELTAEIVPALEVTPSEHVAFGRVEAGTRMVRTVTVRGEAGRPLELGTPRCASSALRIALRALERDPATYELEVVLLPDAPVGILRGGKIEIDTNYAERPVLALPVSARITEPEGGGTFQAAGR
jgi:hypothetical protein